MQLETRNALAMVQAALDQLPLELRAAFVLYEIESESCESIAATWQVPVGTVYSRLHNARKRFLQAYAAHAQHETETADVTAGAHAQTVGR
jgi:RNA polymerase sigma-70 factor (ECF subfamily)